MYNRILAIDFETANNSRGSVCSLGIAIYEDNQIILNKEVLINPEEEFYWYNTIVNGITEEMVVDAPKFPEVWKVINELITENTLIIAHQASFDMSVLRHALDKYEIEYPVFKYICTKNLSKRAYDGLTSYSLDSVGEYLNIEFEHHKASQDALVCLKIFIDTLEKSGFNDIDKMIESYNIKKGEISKDKCKPCSIKSDNVSVKLSEIKSTNDVFDEEHPFYQKNVVFTGTLESMKRSEAAQKVVDVGGFASDNLTKKANFLVMGMQDLRQLKGKNKSSKLIKAETWISKGADLEIIGEDEFLKLL